MDRFLTMLRIGAFTFGGGYAMIALIRERVLFHGWLNEGELLNMIAAAESTIGPYLLFLTRKSKGDDRVILISDAYACDGPIPEGYDGVDDVNFGDCGLEDDIGHLLQKYDQAYGRVAG